MRSCVSMLSLMMTGIPCSGPRAPFAFRSLSSSVAIESASGFNSIMELIVGPCLSMSSIRSRYFLASEWAVYFPEAIPLCKSAMVNSSSSKAGGGRLNDVEAIDVSEIARLTLARPAPPMTPLRTNVLRFIFCLLDG